MGDYVIAHCWHKAHVSITTYETISIVFNKHQRNISHRHDSSKSSINLRGASLAWDLVKNNNLAIIQNPVDIFHIVDEQFMAPPGMTKCSRYSAANIICHNIIFGWGGYDMYMLFSILRVKANQFLAHIMFPKMTKSIRLQIDCCRDRLTLCGAFVIVAVNKQKIYITEMAGLTL